MIKSKSFKVCVFCGSKSGDHDNYLKIAFKVGKELSKKKYYNIWQFTLQYFYTNTS